LPDGAEILNKTELARRLGVTERHIENLIKARQIPHMRLGTKALRFIWADVVRSLSVPSRS
jgi:excisionase family DNA binding protein